MIAVLFLGGAALSAAGLVYVLANPRCGCVEHVGARAVGNRLVGYGLALVVAGWLLLPSPSWWPW